MGPQRRKRGELERCVLAVLAAAERPLTPAEVQGELGGGLAYTTVMTTLSRLVDKGALRREPAGRSYAYSLLTHEQDLDAAVTGRRMSRLLAAGPDRASALTHFVAALDPADEQLLSELLRGTDHLPPPSGDPRPRAGR